MFILQNPIATASLRTLNHSSTALNTTEPNSSTSNSLEANALFFLAYLLILYVLSLWDYWVLLRVKESCNRCINSKTTLSYISYGSMDDDSVPRTRNNSGTLSDDSRFTLLPDLPTRQSSPPSEIEH